jgi:hypothetical protein
MSDYDKTLPGNSDVWRQNAERYRRVLAELGHGAPACFPGEAEDCGGSYAEHVLGFLAAIKARAQFGLNHLACDQGADEVANAEDHAQFAYEKWLAEYEQREGCGRHVTYV